MFCTGFFSFTQLSVSHMAARTLFHFFPCDLRNLGVSESRYNARRTAAVNKPRPGLACKAPTGHHFDIAPVVIYSDIRYTHIWKLLSLLMARNRRRWERRVIADEKAAQKENGAVSTRSARGQMGPEPREQRIRLMNMRMHTDGNGAERKRALDLKISISRSTEQHEQARNHPHHL